MKKSEQTEGESSKAKEQQRQEIELKQLSWLEASGKPKNFEESESEQEWEQTNGQLSLTNDQGESPLKCWKQTEPNGTFGEWQGLRDLREPEPDRGQCCQPAWCQR